jgi:hypothetical protein
LDLVAQDGVAGVVNSRPIAAHGPEVFVQSTEVSLPACVSISRVPMSVLFFSVLSVNPAPAVTFAIVVKSTIAPIVSLLALAKAARVTEALPEAPVFVTS